ALLRIVTEYLPGASRKVLRGGVTPRGTPLMRISPQGRTFMLTRTRAGGGVCAGAAPAGDAFPAAGSGKAGGSAGIPGAASVYPACHSAAGSSAIATAAGSRTTGGATRSTGAGAAPTTGSEWVMTPSGAPVSRPHQ